VYFLLTQRPGTLSLQIDAPLTLFDLSEHREQSLVDARTYLRRASDRPDLAERLRVQRVDPETFVANTAERSEGNFMYLRHIVAEIERGTYGGLELSKLPIGLQAYYRDHWQRMGMNSKPLPRTKIEIVYVLVELLLPVPCSLIASVLSVPPITVQETLDEWAQFLRADIVDGEPCYSVYHSSFRDFLHDKEIVRKANVTIPAINGLIADQLHDQWTTQF
jgi:hypothetical protein